MSQWVHVLMVAEVVSEARLSKTTLKEQIEEIARDYGSSIEGSEGGCEVFVNVPTRHDIMKMSECGDPVFLWSRAYITICGHLRDKTVEEAEDDIKSVITRMKLDFPFIRNVKYHVLTGEQELHYLRNTQEERSNDVNAI